MSIINPLMPPASFTILTTDADIFHQLCDDISMVHSLFGKTFAVEDYRVSLLNHRIPHVSITLKETINVNIDEGGAT